MCFQLLLNFINTVTIHFQMPFGSVYAEKLRGQVEEIIPIWVSI